MKKHNFARLAMIGILSLGVMFYTFKNGIDREKSISKSLYYHKSSQDRIFPILNEPTRIAPNAVSNKDWSEFILFIKTDSYFSNEYVQSMQADGWTMQDDNQPVYGVSWHQANEFCKWKSIVATHHNRSSAKASFSEMIENNKAAKKYIVYRLPSEKEFNILISNKTPTRSTGFICVIDVKHVI